MYNSMNNAQEIKWTYEHQLEPTKQQELVLKGICISQSEIKPNIKAKCPNLKHKAQLVYVQNNGAKTRFKTKSNDQNRSQSFA